MIQVSFESLRWGAAPMPGAGAPVQIAQLPAATDGAFCAFVRFPAGWSRQEAGHYAVAEEFLILEGDLGFNGLTWCAGGYAWIAARRVRRASRSGSGCLAFARFASAPRWIPGDPTEPPPAVDVSFAHWRDAPQGQLYRGPTHRSSIVQRGEVALLATEGRHRETLDLRSFEWRLHY